MFGFRPDTIPSNIFVIGCGGTGSRLVPSLVQFIRSITKEHVPTGWLGSTNIILIDGDVVEAKNLIRQNFIPNDVGKNKAAVLANRYGKAYGMNVVAYPNFIDKKDVNKGNLRHAIVESTGADTHSGNDMVIMCVDSAEARRIVMNALTPTGSHKTVFIDAGNEDSFGQVRMFHNVVITDYLSINHENLRKQYKTPERIELDPPVLSYIPYDPEFYRTLQDNPGLGSCADLDQTLAINSLMAMYILSFVQNYYYGKVIDYNEISVDIVKGSTSYTKNTIANYRNKTVFPGMATDENGWGNVAAGDGSLLGNCMAMEVDDILGSFIRSNDKVVKALLAQQEQEAKASKTVEVNINDKYEKKAKRATKALDAAESAFRQLVSQEVEVIRASADVLDTLEYYAEGEDGVAYHED
jgi:predicted ThiF/HesA family dinucleotide-utilizing enzyme